MLLNRSSRPVIAPDQGWEKGAQLSSVAVFADEATGELLLYYLARFDDKPPANVLCLARSQDGHAWSKQDCGDGTNIVMRASGHRNVWGQFMPMTVLRDERENNPAQRWKMAYWDCPDPSMPPGICLAASADGLHWLPLFQRPIITNLNDASAMIDAIPGLRTPLTNGPFFIYQQVWKYNPELPTERDNLKGMHRRIAIWTCSSFTDGWMGPAIVLEPDAEDEPDIQFYRLIPFRTPIDRYGGLLNCHHTSDQTTDVQLVSSRDGWSWSRQNDRKPVLGLGARGQFDCGMVSVRAQPLAWAGKILVFYDGRSTVHDGCPYCPADPLPNPAEGIGVAEFSEELMMMDSPEA